MSCRRFQGWEAVADHLKLAEANASGWLDDGQCASVAAIRERLPHNGVIIADEVGLGKTRIAVELARAVTQAGGRVAVLVPPGLRFQWQDEFRKGGMPIPPDVGNLRSYFAAWENAPRPWFDQDVVVVSHRFANWRIRKGGEVWRWSLLPLLYVQQRVRKRERMPRGFSNCQELKDPRVMEAAEGIATHAGQSPSMLRQLDAILKEYAWSLTHDEQDYAIDGRYRPLLHRAVGLGLGAFDLVIIDEAHKSRGEESGLSRLLSEVICQSKQSRRVALTATPVELDCEQWLQTLERVEVARTDQLQKAIREYAAAVRAVRGVWQSNASVRARYVEAGKRFQQELSPYVLRRGKRSDAVVQHFVQETGESPDAYREEREILVSAPALLLPWKRAVCAAEAIGLLVPNASDPVAKRLRLTIGNGHGIAALMDQRMRDEDDRHQEAYDELDTKVLADQPEGAAPDEKKAQRVEWWSRLLTTALTDQQAIFDHPSLLAAVEEIERYTAAGQKVLVFGRFTRPLRGLVNLLNARAVIRCVEKGEVLPQERLHQGELEAIGHALAQTRSALTVDTINRYLARQYRQLEMSRKALRDELLGGLQSEFEPGSWELRLLNEIRESQQAHPNGHSNGYLALVRAVHGLVGDGASGSACAEAFRGLMQALRDQGSDDFAKVSNMADGSPQAAVRWATLEERLLEEYRSPEGAFARLLHGETRYETRRFLQLAFNRSAAFPQVLVAQSMVGREGLNLHEACRVVILLHPEWNPGVVEQQIGRVDRINSRWSREFMEWAEAGNKEAPVPRIEVRPVVFQGTYDEHSWQVLRQRWDDLRAQLHGIVVPSRLRTGATEEEWEIIRALDAEAPDFSPRKGRYKRKQAAIRFRSRHAP